jgi:RNA polymerase primary sigma factor
MSASFTRRDRTYQSPLQIYLQEINKSPLLTAEQETAFAERVARGDPEAREAMVRANLRLVVNIARGYLNKGLSLEDLIEEGNLGLMRAVEGFDPEMERRFSTYASFWIKQSMRRAVMNQGKPIRLPAYMVTLMSKWRRATNALAERLGRPPTLEEVGGALRFSKKKTRMVAKALKVNNLVRKSESREDDSAILDEVLTDDRGKAAEDQLIESDDLQRVLERMAMLEPRELAVIRMRYGLDDDGPKTLREIGELLGLTRERVRQLEKQARQKLTSGLESLDE